MTDTGTALGAIEWAISKGVVGVLGLVILGMLYIIRSLWEQVNKLQAEKDQIQRDRLDDAVKNTASLLKVTDRTHEAITSLENTGEAYERLATRRPKP